MSVHFSYSILLWHILTSSTSEELFLIVHLCITIFFPKLETTDTTSFPLTAGKKNLLGFWDTKQSLPVADNILELACPSLLFWTSEGLSRPIGRPELGNGQPPSEEEKVILGDWAVCSPSSPSSRLTAVFLKSYFQRKQANSNSLSWTVSFCHFCS